MHLKHSFSVLFFFSITMVFCQRDMSGVEIKTIKISDNLYALYGAGGNIGVFTGDDGVFMIDDQYAPLSEKIKNAISEISDHPVRFLVNTHHHGDHVGGNSEFSNDGAIIIAHENVRKRLSADQFKDGITSAEYASTNSAWPQITFTQDMNVFINGENIQLIHSSHAHTDGDAMVYFSESNAIHMGDIFFNKLFPFIDLNSGGTVTGFLEAIEIAIHLCDQNTKIIPGHGEIADKSDLMFYYNMIVTMRDRVKSAKDEGKNLEEIKSMDLASEYSDWSWRFISTERFLETLWNDLNVHH